MKVFISSLIVGMEAERAAVTGQVATGWRTRAEHAASPHSITSGFGRQAERERPVMLQPPHIARAALGMDTQQLTQDLVALLRRRWKQADR